MSLSLKDQIVIVSGAGRGLGAAIATAFVREGARVAINYRASREQAEALATKLGDRSKAFQADIRDLEDTKRLVADVTSHFGAPTTVVHNALADFSFNGDARSKLDALSWAEMALQLETALQGALNLIQAARPAMASAGFGRIVTIGTNLFQNPVVPYHDYTAAKAALLSLTRTAAAELGPLGITVNMVSGGLLRTTDASSATPEEVADAVLFFASPWARAVTGQNLIVDGGLVFG